jgi:hypothetical protein
MTVIQKLGTTMKARLKLSSMRFGKTGVFRMSGLYNMIFKTNPLAGNLLKALDMSHEQPPRFRDCFLSEDGTEIIVYTRTGGGNRAEFEKENALLRQHPGFKSDEDDAFDSTYALFKFDVPERYREQCLKLGPMYGVDPAKRWKETLEAMGK